MNKQLYRKLKKQEKELRRLSSLVSCLQTFLKENEKNFEREESIDALKRVKIYLEQKKNEYQDLDNIIRETYKQLCSTCKHEIAIRYSNRPYCYICLICNCGLEGKNELVPEAPLISIDTTKDYEVAYMIESVFKETVYSDKDLIETVGELVEDLQYDRNIKIYRREK